MLQDQELSSDETVSGMSGTKRRCQSIKRARSERQRKAASLRTDYSQKRGTETPYSEKSDHERFFSNSANTIQPNQRKKKRKLHEVLQDEMALKNQNADMQKKLVEATAVKDEAEQEQQRLEQEQQRLKAQRKVELQRQRRQAAAAQKPYKKLRKRMMIANKMLDETEGKTGEVSLKQRHAAQRRRTRALGTLAKETAEHFSLMDEEKGKKVCVIDINKVVYKHLKSGDENDDEEEEKKNAALSVYNAVSDAGVTRAQMRRIVAGVRDAGVDVSAKASEFYTREQNANAARELKLELRTNGTVASALRAVASSLELQHMTAVDFADCDLSLVHVFSWDAWPVCKGGARTFSCSTLAARVLVVRKRPNKNQLCEVVNYGFIDEPGALAVFARLVAPDREQCLLDNDCGVEDIIKEYFDAGRRGDSFRLNLELHGAELSVPVAVMWRCFDAKAARDFSNHRDATHCFVGCGWLPGASEHNELLRQVDFDKTTGKSQLSRLPPLVDTLHFVKNYGANVVGLLIYRFNLFAGHGGARQLNKRTYTLHAAAAANILAQYGVYTDMRITQADKICITASTASAFKKLFKCATQRGRDAREHKRFVVSCVAYELFRDTSLLDDALNYVNACAELWQSLWHAPTADADACELLARPRSTGRSAGAVKRLSRFERLVKQRNKAASAFGLDHAEQGFLYLHIARCHLVELRRFMLEEVGIDLRFASLSAAEALHKEDKKNTRHTFHQLSVLLPDKVPHGGEVTELSKAKKRGDLIAMAEERGLSKNGTKADLAVHLIAHDRFVKQRKAGLAKADEKPDFKHQLQQRDPSFALFKYAAKNQRSAVNKLRELKADEIVAARNKKNTEKRLAERH